MDNLVKRLQEEVGLTEEQALKTVGIVKDFIDSEAINVDWDKVFKGKYSDFVDRVKHIYSNIAQNSDSYTDKIADKLDTLASKARKGAYSFSKKAADFFDEK